ncbi:hypothetical protein [Ruficoccus sp. ZRK36]|uniref:hypothetical protein n=1 Tax=Ruficoccus sp. ZRK36 TaxID=2866311 RepID=UPI001C72A567|nr:hypothetical protein [Ruficoccus sp. ZRK36]QYY34794.1 hypothetical protein K0V07_10835 [Ruficoccus sp. ZRK36]QYY37288.1 hypothetical protein K0V07_07335 [Ruficoccus sp. ZRK36]
MTPSSPKPNYVSPKAEKAFWDAFKLIAENNLIGAEFTLLEAIQLYTSSPDQHYRLGDIPGGLLPSASPFTGSQRPEMDCLRDCYRQGTVSAIEATSILIEHSIHPSCEPMFILPAQHMLSLLQLYEMERVLLEANDMCIHEINTWMHARRDRAMHYFNSRTDSDD